MILLIAVTTRIWPFVSWRFKTYPNGTGLVTVHDSIPFGTVLEYTGDHTFANGATASAYRVSLVDSGQERWLTKKEVNRLAKPARASGLGKLANCAP